MLSRVSQYARPMSRVLSKTLQEGQKRGIAHDGFKGIKFEQARLDRLGGGTS